MAKNTVYMWTRSRPLPCTDPATPASGDPVLCGQIPGVALAAKGTDGLNTVALDGAFLLSVKGTTGSDSAVAVGDAIYYATGGTPKLSKTSSGVLFGYSLGIVGAGATATIPVEVGKA